MRDSRYRCRGWGISHRLRITSKKVKDTFLFYLGRDRVQSVRHCHEITSRWAYVLIRLIFPEMWAPTVSIKSTWNSGNEAHDLRPATLRMLQLLTNFDMDSKLIVSIIFCGQPSLKEGGLSLFFLSPTAGHLNH